MRAWITRGDPYGLAGLAVGLLACLALLVVPIDSPPWVAISRVGGIVSMLVVIAATVRMPLAIRSVWWWFSVFAILVVLGDIAYDVQQYMLDEVPFPGLADPLYLASYVAAFLALSLLIRKVYAKRDREAWIDAAIIVVAAASLAATVVIAPMLDGVQTLDAPTLLALAYPVLDLVLLAGLVRLLVGMGRLRLSMTLLTTSFAVYLVADVLYNASVVYGFDDATRAFTEALYLAALVLLAGAATAPDARELASPQDASALVRPKSLRLAALTIGVLTAPALLFALSWSEGQTLARMLAAATIVVILLALWRIRELLSTVDDQAVQLDQQARTDSLTGLPNRRTLDYQLERAVARGRPATGLRSPSPCSISTTSRTTTTSTGIRQATPCWRPARAPGRRPPHPGRSWRATAGRSSPSSCPGWTARPPSPHLERLRQATPGPVTVSIGYFVRPRRCDQRREHPACRPRALLGQGGRARPHRRRLTTSTQGQDGDQSDAASSSATRTSVSSRTSSSSSPG